MLGSSHLSQLKSSEDFDSFAKSGTKTPAHEPYESFSTNIMAKVREMRADLNGEILPFDSLIGCEVWPEKNAAFIFQNFTNFLFENDFLSLRGGATVLL